MDTTTFYQKTNPPETINRIQNTVKTHGGLLILLRHHAVFNERESPGWTNNYEMAIRTAQVDGAWITTGKIIMQWLENNNR